LIDNKTAIFAIFVTKNKTEIWFVYLDVINLVIVKMIGIENVTSEAGLFRAAKLKDIVPNLLTVESVESLILC